MVLEKAARVCAVCASSHAASHHFGARSCKACAAFFRRSVSAALKYVCVAAGSSESNACTVHHSLRMVCRACRYLKCIRGGMQAHLVQNKRDSNRMKSIRRSAPRRASQSEAEFGCCDESPSQDIIDEFFVPARLHNDPVDTTIISYEIEDIPSAYDDGDAGDFKETCASETFSIPFTLRSDHSTVSSVVTTCSKTDVLEIVLNAERFLNDRRRMLYSGGDINSIFSSDGHTPYNKAELLPMNFLDHIGLSKADLMMVYDYCRCIPGFERLAPTDKKYFFREMLGIDSLLTTSYLSLRLGRPEGWMVHYNGRYLKMDPLPCAQISADSSSEERLCTEAIQKYQLFMPLKIRHYVQLIRPFTHLQFTFTEYAALKALSALHMSRLTLSKEGRTVTGALREEIMLALQRHCTQLLGVIDGSVRFGNIVLLMSSLFEVMMNLYEAYVKIDFFNLAHVDPLLSQMVAL